MFIGLLNLRLHFPESESLKDRRAILRKTMHRLRTDHNISIAEVDCEDKWQAATLAVVAVSDSRAPIEGIHRRILDDLETAADLQLSDYSTEWL